MNARTPELGAGTVIDGRYELIKLVGEGGMGAVWRARQINLNREVALKLLIPADFESGDDARRRFAREAHVASAIKHPNVIEIYDVGEHKGLTFLAMEMLEGLSLRDRLGNGDEMLAVDFIIDIASALTEALVAAHALGAVHRDLKPENIFLEHKGQNFRVVVLDFGLAFIEEDDQLGRMTRHGVVMGTPHYLSPEQARGLEVGPAADIYSLACVIYELLTGEPPFSGSSLNVMTQHLYVSPVPVGSRRPQLPRELEELTMAMLRKRPEQRPRIAEVRDQLALLATTLSGRRDRGRDATYLQSRAERMLSFSPTAPLPRVGSNLVSSLDSEAVEFHVAAIGEVTEDIDLGLLSNDIALMPWPVLEGEPPADVLLVANVEPETLLDQVREAVATGLPVVVAIPSDARELMGELARVGVAEITSLPLAIDNLVRAVRRAKKRHDRRERARIRKRQSEEL